MLPHFGTQNVYSVNVYTCTLKIGVIKSRFNFTSARHLPPLSSFCLGRRNVNVLIDAFMQII